MSSPVSVKRIVTHHRPHFDELLAIRLLKKFGGEKFPNIREARVEYSRNGESPEGKTWQQHREEGTILVGTGGGPFDEHPTSQGEERKKSHSACSLVAAELELERHPVYKRLIELVTEADQTGIPELHVANRLKTRYRLYPDAPEKAIDFALDILDDWEDEQQLFLDAQRQLQALACTDSHHRITSPAGGALDIVVVQSDNYKMSAAARSLKIAVIIQVQPTGHVQVFTDTTRIDFRLNFVVANWREAEMLANGMSKKAISKLSSAYLEQQGKITEVPNLFYQVPGENLLNGSETTPDTAPTKVSIPKIVKIVKTFILAETAAMV